MWSSAAALGMAALTMAAVSVPGNSEGVSRSCGTLEPSVQEREYQKTKLSEYRKLQPEAARAARLNMKVVFHVIHDGNEGKYVLE